MELVPCSVAQNRKRSRESPKVPVAPDSTSTTLDDLCDSLLIQILSRLPLKQLKRCQAVSKHWYALISDPFLIRLFGEKHKTFAFLLNYVESFFEWSWVFKFLAISNEPDDFKSEGFSLSFLPFCRSGLEDSATIQASSNDLLLCSDGRRNVFYVCNPFTLSWIQLPPNPPFRGSAGVGFVCNYPYSDSSACRYTVLRVIHPFDDRESEIKVHIYSSDVGEWKENVVSCGQRAFVCPPRRTNGVYYNGLMFFLSHEHGLMGFDPYEGGELRHFIHVPKEFFHYYFRCFRVCRERMRLFQITDYPVSFIRIWDLKDYEKGEWIMEKQVYLKDMIPERCDWVIKEANTDQFLPITIACDPNDGDVVYFGASRRKRFEIVSCNMRMGTLEKVCDFPSVMFVPNEVITYKPSWCPTPISSRMP